MNGEKKIAFHKMQNDLSNSYSITEMEIWLRLRVFRKSSEKMREQDILEKLCDRIVEAVHETFIRKFYFVKISQSKLEHIFLIVRKWRGRLLGVAKDALHRKICEIIGCVFEWYKQKYSFLSDRYFFEFNLLKDCSEYHFDYFLVSRDKYANSYFLSDVFLSTFFRNFFVSRQTKT